ncbi:hypothetical protein WKV44_00170 [Spirochaetia bacterium 38H-sp]|uniref:DUF6938 domain-containing protein n=1 Tax=Rarispira pelagica TaxID=3141764 RepID=A0ABU9U9W1_9SPIR
MTETKENNKVSPEAWVVTVDMGLGHQRATAPFYGIARDGIISVGSHSSSDEAEKALWEKMLGAYEFLSRVRAVPLVGKPLFSILDSLQNIPPLYPLRDLSSPSYQVKLLHSLVKKGLCKGMLQHIKTSPLPLLTSHPAPAIAADEAGYGRIYCIVCDAEISRAWVAMEPARSRIHYLVPCGRALRRLKAYGVPDERIFLTGFPMPLELLGDKNLDVLKHDVGQRLHYLDPKKRFWPLHEMNVKHFLGGKNIRFKNERLFTVTFAVGGAGAQVDIGCQILESVKNRIKNSELCLNLVAGVRKEVKKAFEETKKRFAKDSPLVNIIYADTKEEYFRLFAETIRKTDVLWTKPSELSFYAGLGLPIIMAPDIGAQERYNKAWLQEIQAGIMQEDPRYTSDWLWLLLEEGRLAESAWDGFLKARKYGTYKIMEVLETGTMQRETSPLKR